MRGVCKQRVGIAGAQPGHELGTRAPRGGYATHALGCRTPASAAALKAYRRIWRDHKSCSGISRLSALKKTSELPVGHVDDHLASVATNGGVAAGRSHPLRRGSRQGHRPDIRRAKSGAHARKMERRDDRTMRAGMLVKQVMEANGAGPRGASISWLAGERWRSASAFCGGLQAGDGRASGGACDLATVMFPFSR